VPFNCFEAIFIDREESTARESCVFINVCTSADFEGSSKFSVVRVAAAEAYVLTCSVSVKFRVTWNAGWEDMGFLLFTRVEYLVQK